MITDPTDRHNSQERSGPPAARRLLAPHLWPFRPETGAAEEDGGPWFYLSWPGWELYLARRWGWKPAGPEAPRPLLLPDLTDPERDFAAIDQLIRKAAEMGAGFLALIGRPPESLAEVRGALRHYSPEEKTAPAPALDDRSYLALWAATEYQARQSRDLLAETARRQKAMWAALKGEEAEPAPGALQAPPDGTGEPDRRAAYAWRCWRRLAAPLLRPSDILIPTAPGPDDQE